MSKLRYGLQLCNQVRTKPDDPENMNMKSAQLAQNKMLRMFDGVSLKEHILSSSLLQKYNIASVNQLAEEIKLVEAWKAIHINSYPFKMEQAKKVSYCKDRRKFLTMPSLAKNYKDIFLFWETFIVFFHWV